MDGFTSVNPDAGVPSNGAIPPTPPHTDDLLPEEAHAGAKRKREARPTALKFYAVRVGREPGIYHTWADCLGQVRGFPKAVFKSFPNMVDAQAFVNYEDPSGGGSGTKSTEPKYYAVRSGHKPGVYDSWAGVLEQIRGWKGPKHRVFRTLAEAELFVAEGNIVNDDNSTVESIEPLDPHTSASKKAKTTASSKSRKSGAFKDESPMSDGPGEYEPGTAPLSPSASDNFDTAILLDPASGTARYKTASEHAATTLRAAGAADSAPVKIYTDGSSLANGQIGAMAGVGVFFGPTDARNISEPLPGSRQTNQRAELMAVVRALEVAPRDRKVVIYSDSDYAIKSVTEWFVKWRANGWTNAAGRPVENKDLVSKIVDMLEERWRLNRHRAGAGEGEESDGEWGRGPASVEFVWVKGHAKDAGNNAADQLAVDGARAAKELAEDVLLD